MNPWLTAAYILPLLQLRNNAKNMLFIFFKLPVSLHINLLVILLYLGKMLIVPSNASIIKTAHVREKLLILPKCGLH
jgi:hypothetical protein